MKVAVIALNWNGENLLPEYLPYWIKTTNIDNVELIVVDNGSSDRSREILSNDFPEVKTIYFEKNYGFAEGYNRAISMVDADIVVLLNSDAEPIEGWLDEPIKILSMDNDVVAIQPKILSRRDARYFEYAGAAGGFIDKYGYPFCRGRIFSSIEEDKGQYDDTIDIFWASGAALIIRRDDYIGCGGLDADFFAHQEEIDLCWRLRARGRRIIFCPQSKVLHYGGASLDVNNPKKTYLNFRNNLLMIYKNMPNDRLNKVLRIRFILDFISIILFIVKFQLSNAKAVFRAIRDFRRMKSQFSQKRQCNIDNTSVTDITEIKDSSVVVQYFIKGHKIYSDLD